MERSTTGKAGANAPTDVQTGPNADVGGSGAPAPETPLPVAEIDPNTPPPRRTEVGTTMTRGHVDAFLASAHAQALFPSPALLERYEILSILGHGGMGVVYRARDRASGEVVAVKVLLESRASAVERFAREAAVLSGLDHPGIVRYGAHGVTDAGEPYLVMEWLDGESLSGRLGRGTLTVDETLMLATRVSAALAAAHARGVVHRDLKPSNLFLVDRDLGRVKILDFGIAYLGGATPMTKTGALIGTLGYMAPEQARGETRDESSGEASLTPAADIFALGCVLFEALAGRPAFEGQNAMTILAKLIFAEVPLLEAHCPEAPPALAALIARMLAKDPAARPADGGALAAELSALSAEFSAPSAPSAPSALSALWHLESAQTAVTNSIRRPHALTETEQRVVSVVMIRPDAERALAVGGGSLSGEVRGAAEQSTGRIAHLADGSIAVVFGGPGVVKDYATLAARFALVIQARLPPASIALATGRGAPRNTPLLGEAIERAAQRIEREHRAPAAGLSPVAIDETTAALLDARFEWRKGAAGPELLGEREAAGMARRLLGKPMPCVGRER